MANTVMGKCSVFGAWAGAECGRDEKKDFDVRDGY